MKSLFNLNNKTVTVITSNDNGQCAKCYENDSFGRKELQEEVPEPYLFEILEAWGDQPTVFPPVRDVEDVRQSKIASISAACNQTVIAGFNLTLSDGSTRHFSLEETDQINISTALMAVQKSAQEYPYHADGEVCSLFSGRDIIAVATAATQHKLYHTTYGNHLLTWVRRAETAEELESIYYGAALPEDLAANMQAVMAAMEAGNAV